MLKLLAKMKKWHLVLPIACIMAFSSPMLVGKVFSSDYSRVAAASILSTGGSYTSDVYLTEDMTNFSGAESIENATFDGKGKTINLKTSGEKQGLFKTAKNSVIKNVKIVWSPNFKDGTNIGEIVAGALVAEATDTTIENCEVEIHYEQTQDVSFKFTIGGLAGKLTDSQIDNCGVYGNFDLNLNLGNLNYTNRLGGLVGIFEYSNLSNCINFSDVNLKNEGFAQNIYIGGLVGDISGSTSTLRNSVNVGSITTSVSASDIEMKGGIAGYVKSSDKPAKDNIASVVYVGANLLPFGSDETLSEFYNSNILRLSAENKASVFTESFFKNASSQITLSSGTVLFSWYRSAGWDLDSKWSVINATSPELRLQVFQSFSLKASNSVDNGKNLLEATNTSASKVEYKYGEEWILNVDFKDKGNIGYYRAESVLKEGLPVDFAEGFDENADVYLVRNLNADGEEESYSLHVKASSKTEGSYSFEVSVVEYTGYVAVANADGQLPTENEPSVGGKAVFSGSGMPNRNFSKDSDQFSVRATADLNYKFISWKAFRPAKGEEENAQTYFGKSWVEVPDANLGTSSVLSNKRFGEELFEKDFLLLAVFNDNIFTLILNFDESQIDKIKIGETEVIQTGANAVIDKSAPISMKVYMKSGYMLDKEGFENFLRGILNDEAPLPRITENLESNGTKSYSFTLIASNLRAGQELNDNITFKVLAMDESLSKGINLGAVIGGSVAGVVVLLGILFFLLWWFGIIGHRGYSVREKREEKRKQSGEDYKKYFF